MTSLNEDIFNPFRDPVYEEMGFIFDPERNQYFEIVVDPRFGEMRRYLSPRNGGDGPQVSEARSKADLVLALTEANKKGGASDREMQLMLQSKAKARGEEVRKMLESKRMDAMERGGMLQGMVGPKGRGYQAGGAVNDIDIFEETRRSIRDDQTPMMPTVTNEQPMFEMPGVDRVFTQIMTSPDFRSIVRVEDVPPENLQQSKKIFEFLMKRDGIDQAVQYLVDTFGKATMFPIEKSLGPDPRTQRVSGMEESRMSSGIGSLMQ